MRPSKKGSSWKRVLHALYVNASDGSFFMRGDPKYVPQGFWDNKHALAKHLRISGQDLGISLSFLDEQKLIKNYLGNETKHIELTPEGFKLAIEHEKNQTEKFHSRTNIALTVVLVAATVGIFWIGWESYIPKLQGPIFDCPDQLFLEKESDLTMSFGNYGNSPVSVIYFWNGTNVIADDTFQPKGYYSDSLLLPGVSYVPANFNNGQQNSFKFLMRIESNESEFAAFSLKYLDIDYRNPIDSFFKRNFFESFAVKQFCEYQKSNNNVYELIAGSRLSISILVPN